MVKNNLSIEIVRTPIIAYSTMNLASCKAVAAVLTKHYTHVRISSISCAADLLGVVSRRPDLVFCGMEYIPFDSDGLTKASEKVWLSELFDSYGIAYTGSDRMAIELGRNKQQAKQQLINAGIKTPAFCTITLDRTVDNDDIPLKYPVFIKPSNLGGGKGIDSNSVAYDFEEARSKIKSIHDHFRSDALIEEYLPGREFSAAILLDILSLTYDVYPLELFAPPDARGLRLLSNEVKTSNVERVVGVTDLKLKESVSTLAIRAFGALGARDYGRIDIRLDRNGTPNFLEANFLPSLISGYGSFPKACLINCNMSYESMIVSIVELGLKRNPLRDHTPLNPEQYNDRYSLSDIVFGTTSTV